MKIRHAYNQWAAQYDFNQNKTRDLEAISLRSLLNGIYFENCLEIGCGTGKNTEWLITRAKHVTAVDLSEEMLDCYTHPVSEFTRAAINNGFSILEIDEFWDKDDANGIPRIFAMLLRKK
ncbi:MAG: methyltransferase domain-containing protein [Bacteroidales bacterium]|nr:methyltransferase domain-containing protein [Bacteroidales bacterium]